MCQRIVQWIDSAIDSALILFFALLFLIGCYTMYDTYLVYNQSEGESLKHFKPLQTGDEGGWNLSALSEDAVAWLTIDNTGIDYPVMQGETNSEYLNKDPYGEYSLSGSLFLDSRNDPAFADSYSLIYGHHMDHGAMFGALDEYADEAYLTRHSTGTLSLPDMVYRFHIFACLDTDASAGELFKPGGHTAAETLAFAEAHAVVWHDPEQEGFADGDRLLALSTCKYQETTERIVVLGYLNEEEANRHE